MDFQIINIVFDKSNNSKITSVELQISNGDTQVLTYNNFLEFIKNRGEDINEVLRNYNSNKFKVLYDKEFDCYGIIEYYSSNEIIIGTASTPKLFTIKTTIEKLKSYFNGKVLFGKADNDGKFNWDEDIGDRWELIDVEINKI